MTISRWKYWVGCLIGGHADVLPFASTPPQPKMGNSMPCSSMNFYGYLTNDIKVVEWYVACQKANGVAVYFTEVRDDDVAYPRGYDASRSIDCDLTDFPVMIHGNKFADGWGMGFSEWLYDPADEDLANQEVAYRDKTRAAYVAHWEARRLALGRDKSGRTPADYKNGERHQAEWLAKSIREQPRPRESDA
jgi:hypothetical protein